MDAQDDLGRVTRNHQEDGKNGDGDKDERQQENKKSFE